LAFDEVHVLAELLLEDVERHVETSRDDGSSPQAPSPRFST
jgi:hypothetical protein